MLKLLHTADWHAGKVLMQRDRTPDLAVALEQMLQIIEAEGIDAFLLCGDVFDTFNPPTHARKVIYDFFLQLHQLGIPAVVISGNHDSASLFDSIRGVWQLAGVHLFDKPRVDNHLTLEIRGEKLHIAALPYPSEHRLATLLKNQAGFSQQLQTYAEQVGQLMARLAEKFPPDGVRVLCAHLMVSGARISQTERILTTADVFAVSGQNFPPGADYVALGHIHKRQEIPNAPVKAWYPGSPLHMDFGEARDRKGVNLVELAEGQVAKVHFRELTPPKELKEYRVKRSELDEVLQSCQGFPGYLKLRVQLEAPEPGLADRLWQELGASLLALQLELPGSATSQQREAVTLQDPLAAYRAYYAARQQELRPEVEAAFQQLLERIQP